MKVNRDCDIVKDLLPLCVDQVASKASVDFVNDHIKNCEKCNKIMEDMKSTVEIPDTYNNHMNDIGPFIILKKQLSKILLRTAVVCVIIIIGTIAISHYFL
ncbi:MAG: hypothetical protein SOV71_00085 [Anaerovoracaceae bacterium]|nr:hypothetical protein [Anaerovoracaceae bacterium]